MIETSEVRRRVQQAIERARRAAAAHRADADLARSRFEAFVDEIAAPVFRQAAQALRVEGYVFQVFTPAGAVRLASERSGDDFVEIALDTARTPVALVGRTSVARGRRVEEEERVFFEGPDLDRIDEERLLTFLVDALAPLITR